MCANCKFSPGTKKKLEIEAGFACANPSCRRTTVSPSDTRASGLSQRGEGAHITGATMKAARYNGALTHDERSAADNGIWLCRDHAKAIDDDARRFTTALLHRWKDMARTLSQTRADAFDQVAHQEHLIEARRSIMLRPDSKEALRSFVGEFLEDVGAVAVWADEPTESVRQLLTEMCFNIATHGSATCAELVSSSLSITLEHNGAHFSMNDLLNHSRARGGADGLRTFRAAYGNVFVCGEAFGPDKVSFVVSDIRFRPASDNPCSISSRQLGALSIEQLGRRDCPETHVYLRARWTMSDGYADLPKLEELARSTTHSLVIHSERLSPLLTRFVEARLPSARIALTVAKESLAFDESGTDDEPSGPHYG